MLKPSIHRSSKLQEARAARDYGGKTRPGSGNQWHSKGDVSTLDYLIECKTTSKESYSLKYETLSKIWKEAILESKIPLVEILFSEHDKAFVIMDKQDFLEMKTKLESD